MTTRKRSKRPVSSSKATREDTSAQQGDSLEVQFRPSKSGFFREEAVELLGMCTAANFLGPVSFSPFPVGLSAANDPSNPLPDDDGKTYPYPFMPIWPEGWAPGIASEDPSLPWKSSIVVSRLASGAGVNSAIVAYHSERDAYAIAFAGTLNPGAAMEDIAGILIPAGPVDLGYFKSQETYVHAAPGLPVPPVGGGIVDPLPEPPNQPPLVHLGYREAVESLSIGHIAPANLASILKNLPGEEIDLYVTGHSLGASVAQLFSAWIQAGGISSKKINVKCYSFATPKSCNAPMAWNYNLSLGNAGFSFNVNNTLDTAPQLPPTEEKASDLVNPMISTDVLSKAAPTGVYADSPLAPIVKMIMQSGVLPGAESKARPAGETESAPNPIPFPFPFPFSIPFHFIHALGKAAATTPDEKPKPASMAFVGMGTPYTLPAVSPVVYNGRCYPSEFFPAREADDLVEIPDATTRQWWQHWPYNYAKYLAAAADQD